MTRHQDVVLIIADDPDDIRAVSLSLRARGYDVSTVKTAMEALEVLTLVEPSCVILDLDLPDWSAFDILQRLRTSSHVPVIVLSTSGDEAQKLAAFDFGADDYVTKPYSIGELMARVRVAYRRGNAWLNGGRSIVKAGEVCIDLDAAQVTVEGRSVRLSRTEYRLIATLAENVGRLCTNEFLLQQVWGPAYRSEAQYVRVYIARLRAKLSAMDSPSVITTEQGLGYRLVVREPESSS